MIDFYTSKKPYKKGSYNTDFLSMYKGLMGKNFDGTMEKDKPEEINVVDWETLKYLYGNYEADMFDKEQLERQIKTKDTLLSDLYTSKVEEENRQSYLNLKMQDYLGLTDKISGNVNSGDYINLQSQYGRNLSEVEKLYQANKQATINNYDMLIEQYRQRKFERDMSALQKQNEIEYNLQMLNQQNELARQQKLLELGITPKHESISTFATREGMSVEDKISFKNQINQLENDYDYFKSDKDNTIIDLEKLDLENVRNVLADGVKRGKDLEQENYEKALYEDIISGKVKDGMIVMFNYGGVDGANKQYTYLYNNGKLYKTTGQAKGAEWTCKTAEKQNMLYIPEGYTKETKAGSKQIIKRKK